MSSNITLTLVGRKGSSKAAKDQEAPFTKGQFSPILLQPEKTVIFLEDYFPNGEWPDSVNVDYLNVELLPDEKQVVLSPKEGAEVPALGLLELAFGDHNFAIPLKRSRVEKHVFVFDPEGTFYEKVQLGSIINDWDPEQGEMAFKNGKWYFEVYLEPGLYAYQFVLDGEEWISDPKNEDPVPNGFGGYNSQLRIGGDIERLNWRMARTKKGLKLKVNAESVSIAALYENGARKVTSRKNDFLIPLPEDASEGRSFFQIYIGNNETGEVADCLIPLEDGKPVTKASQLGDADQHANIIYFLLVDRFHNGDPSFDPRLHDPRVHEKVDYHGGDLLGVTKKIEEGFFDDMGVNTIWISPLYQNPDVAYQEFPEPRRWFSGYHGYWPISSTKIDHRFGTKEILKELVDKAHSKGKKVLLDFVANHVHEDHELIKENPDWATDWILPDGTTNIRLFDAQRLTTWFDTFLPSLDFSREEVIEIQSDYALYWMNEFGLDGFRHDATKHVPETFWRRLTQKMKQNVDRPMFQIGETVGNRKLIGRYVGSGMLDGQFDFNLFYDLRDTLASDYTSAVQMVKSLQASIDDYGFNHLMGNFTGTHDMPRVITYAGAGLEFFEDPKEAGWNRDIHVTDPVAYDKIKLLHAFLMIGPGIPVIYYGDEYGMCGADDPDNRRDMIFEGHTPDEASVLEAVQSLTKFRSSHLATIYGSTEALAADREVFFMVRRYLGEVVVLAINFGDTTKALEVPASLDLPEKLKLAVSSNGASLTELPGNSFAVLLGKE